MKQVFFYQPLSPFETRIQNSFASIKMITKSIKPASSYEVIS
jgi:hypothetical protein